MTNDVKLGEILRKIRNINGWTLKQVSEMTDISVSTLSKVERDKLSLTYDKLVKLANGLNIDFTSLFTNSSEDNSSRKQVILGRRSTSRGNDGDRLDTPKYNHIYLHNEIRNRAFIPIVAEVKAKSIEEFGPLISHPGEEFSYVLEGAVFVHTEYYEPSRLAAGESIYFDSNMKHGYVADPECGVCKILSVCSATKEELLKPFDISYLSELSEK